MASSKVEKKRKRSRKARTEVSSSSSSDSESPPQPSQTKRERVPHDSSSSRPAARQETQDDSNAVSEDERTPTMPQSTQPSVHPQQAFEAFYLQQATREFAEDLEKLRSAPDFHNERSVPVLIEALRQGTACFGEADRRKIIGVGGERT